ncbi:MAG: VOC family protein [Pseudomonadota bacterium]
MEQRVSLITLGVDDLERSAAFYERMGWKRVETDGGLVVFDLIGQVLGLYPKADLARDMEIDVSGVGGFSGLTLAHNVRDKSEVGLVMSRAEAAGAKVIREAHDIFWGGHVGYFADPDGHVWEIAWNPFSTLGPKGEFQWGGV